MYWAAKGQGAHVQRPGQEPQRLQAAAVDLSAPGLVVVRCAHSVLQLCSSAREQCCR